MTDNQINQAIAEACGWTDVHFSLAATDEFPTERRIVGIPPKHRTHDVAPKYCTDLNAMHEAEKTIFPYYATVYANKLARATKADYSDDTEYFCATARQRAEAFLMALGKWESTTEESSAVQSTSSGGSGGASTYGGKGLGIAGAAWPPETRITVNGKTFCLADIDKEMTE